jgi:hypothetical protein
MLTIIRESSYQGMTSVMLQGRRMNKSFNLCATLFGSRGVLFRPTKARPLSAYKAISLLLPRKPGS